MVNSSRFLTPVLGTAGVSLPLALLSIALKDSVS